MSNISLFRSDMLETISGECQCCLLKSDYLRSMMKEYPYKGELEIYGGMLLESLSIRVLGINPDALICNACIDKLRDVLTFKRMVEDNLKNFENRKHTKEPDPEIESVQLKVEYVSEDEDRDDFKHSDDEQNLEELRSSCQSDNVLEQALKRTKENLELLKSTLREGETIESLLNAEQYPRIKADISVPIDKKARNRFLAKRRHERGLPYKVEKTDRVCKLCSKEFNSYSLLVQHMAEHFPNHICNICGKLFVMRRQLDHHMWKNHNAKVVQCPICNIRVKENNMRRHNMKHTGVKAYKCRYCPEKFDGYLYQIRHMVNVHNHQRKEYKCSICSKVFEISSARTTHMKTVHLNEKKHICIECDKPFRSKSALERHMVKHTQIRNYKCEVCHKAYLGKSALTAHMKIHYNIKNYVCAICDKAFTQKCSLDAHSKTHNR